MLTVTDAAVEQLKQITVDATDEDVRPLRVFRSGEGLALGRDEAKPEDQKVEAEGQTLLVFDDEISDLLADRTLDVRDTDEGAVLVVR